MSCQKLSRSICVFLCTLYLTCHDIVPDDLDVVVSIRPRVLVPEANHVAQLVDHDAELVAVLSDGDGLSATTTLADERTASRKKDERVEYERSRFGSRLVITVKYISLPLKVLKTCKH